MSFIQILLIHISTSLLGSLMVAIYVALSITGLIIIRKFYPHDKCKLHNDVAGLFLLLSASFMPSFLPLRSSLHGRISIRQVK